MQIRTFALISALALALPACTSQTLGNVQLTSHDGQVAVDAVNHQEARAIQAAVIAATREMHPVDGEATFLLLTGSTYGSYESVGAKLGKDYVLPDQAASDLPFYGVRSVRTQKDQGDVTVVVPNADKLGLVDVQVEAKKTAEGRSWEVVRLTDRSAAINSLADLIAEENKAVVVAPVAEQPEVKAPEQAGEAKQPESFNWFERNIQGKQTEEQKAAAAAEKATKAEAQAAAAEAKAAQEAEEKAAKAAAEAAKAEATAAKAAEEKAAKAAEEKAAKEAKGAEEAKQPEHFNWFERNILGKQTEEQKAAAAAEKAAKAEAKAAKEAEEKAADEAKKAEKQAAEEAKAAAKAAEAKAAAEAKPAEEAKQPESFNWFERNILGKQTEEQKAAAAAEKAAKAEAKAAKEAEEKAAEEAEAAAKAAAAEKAAAEKPAEAAPATTGKKRSTWFESKVLGKDKAPEAEPAK